MSQSVAGNLTATLKSEEPSFDPDYGYSIRQVWTGTKAMVLSVLQQMAVQGYRARITKITGGSWQCECQIPTIPDDSKVDRFEIDTEWSQESVFRIVGIEPEITQINLENVPSDWNLSKYRDAIEEDARNGKALRAPLGAYPLAFQLWQALARGQEAYELRRIVLRRRRSRPISWATPVILTAEENFYLTRVLIALFGIPPEIAQQLPPDPAATPSNSVWAWKARTDTSTFIPAFNRVEEQKEWVFSAWPTLFYNVVTNFK